ncbi:Ig-like domain-containing protein [Spirosoma lituiforme]
MKKMMLAVVAGLTMLSNSALAQRDPLKWPFAKTSIWNIPIHNSAVYAPANIQDASYFEADEDVVIFKPNEPLMKVETNYAGWSGQDRCPVQGPTLFSAPIPSSFIYDKNVWVGRTPNAGVAILQPDGKIWQAQPFAKCATDVATAQYTWAPDGCVLTGECIEGAHGGSHLSAIGGTIRVGEFASGKIPHVIKLNLFGKENFYHDATGGKRWPATNQDGGYNDPSAYNYYGGTNPEMKIGALLALNKDVVLNSVSDNSLGLKTQAGLILARTLRDYGGYTVDNTAGDSYAFITETGPEGSVRQEFKQLYGYDINGNLGSSDWTNDLKLLFKNLYVITNNTQGNPGGGPIIDLTNRRAPAAPDFTPAQTFKIMPMGDSKIEGGGGGNAQASWRGFLRTRLMRNGYKIDYVGDRQNYAEGDTIPNDKDHAGHGGYTIGPDIQKFCPTCETTGLYEHIQDYLPQANPDIVLLAIGINDMFGETSHAPGYKESAPQRYQDLVNKILQLKPGVRLILGTVEPVKWDKNWGSNPDDKSLGALNAKIRAIANASDTDNIFLADVYQKMLATWDPGDYFDDLHLSKQGATKDANAWFDALVPILNNTPANVAPTVNLTSPVNSATFAAPATINFEAEANDSDGSVTKVEFFNGAAKVGEATASPFRYTWNDVDEGTYLLKAVATDNLFATATSAVDTVTVKSTDGYVKFTGTGIGSPGSYENNGKTFAKALDGDLATYFDGATPAGQWVGLDFGVAKTVRKVRIVPRTAWALRIVGGKIQGSNSPDFSSAVDLYTFTQTPIEGFYTTGRFATTGLYRYYRFLSPNTGYGNISELEFWGNSTDPTNQVPVCKIDSSLNNTRLAPGASLTLTASASDPDGSITKVEFFSGTALIGTSTAAPYQYVWTNIPVGTYFVTAKATDNAGVTKSSDAVKITVDNLGSDVLYAEDYNTNTAVGWQTNGGTWTATNQRYESSNTNGEFTSFYNGASFSNYSYAVDAVASWDNNIGVVFNYQNTNNYYLVTFNSKSKTVDLKKKVNGVLTTIASTTFAGGGTGATHAILVTNSGGTTTVKINGNTVFNNVATPDFMSGKIGLYSFYCPARFDNVVVRSVGGSTAPVPTVALTSPVANATFTAPATITLTASASDAGGFTKVEFFNGTTLLGTATNSPYAYVWSNVAAGTYALTAKATNTSGTAVTSSTVSVTVGGAPVAQDAIAFNKPPMVVNPGQSYTVNVNYTATTKRIIDVYLFNAQYQTIASKNVQVEAGSGTQAVILTIPAGAAPIKGGNWSVNLWKSDWSAVVKSSNTSGVRVNARPTVSLTSPAESATFTAGANIELAATATDSDGTVSKVEFFNGATSLGTATTSPYAFTLTNVLAGTYTLTAKASDNDSLAATSTATTITVQAAPSAKVRVLHKDVDNNVANNVIKPTLQIVNEGDAPLVYGQLTLRYWLTAENFAPLTNLPIYYAQLGGNKIRTSYVALDNPRQGAWGYVEYRFDESAGQLAPGGNSGEIQSGIAKQNNTNVNEADDYSYANAQTFTANNHITAYLNGKLVWGTEPAEVAAQQRLTVYTQNRSNGANTINTYLQVRNEGNVPVNYQDVKVRYYLTAEGNPDKLRFYLDYALLGNSNVTGRFVKLDPAQASADAYLELSFNTSLGAIYPASNTGDVQYRIAKDDWTNLNQTNDHSYLVGTDWTENSRAVIYVAGQRVWGQEPGSGARVAAGAEIPFEVTILGNPVSGPEVAVEVRGAEGQPLRLQVIDTKGALVSHQLIEQATASEQVRLSSGQLPTGLLILRVSTPSQTKTVKILKENP